MSRHAFGWQPLLASAVCALMLPAAACTNVGLSSSNEAPSARLLDPVSGAEHPWGETLPICARIEDPDPGHPLEALRIIVTSGLNGVLWDSSLEPAPLDAACGTAEGNVALEARDLLEGEHTISVTVWDPLGASAREEVLVSVVRPANTPPGCELLSPAPGSLFYDDETLEVVARVWDDEDPTDGLERAWTSSIDGPLGTGSLDGEDLSHLEVELATLTPGAHFVSLSLSDARGEVGACGVPIQLEACADRDDDGVGSCEGDCDDDDPNTWPGAPELPDGRDNDCNGVIDDGTALRDDDGDGFAEYEGDCDDDDPTAYPGAPELADGADNDCDGIIDDGTEVYDDDRDGFSEVEGDCDDADASRAPDVSERPCDGIDSNCSGDDDEASDGDGDGYDGCDPTDAYDGDGLPSDCAPTRADIYPGAPEVLCDGLDNSCGGGATDAPDADDDGYDRCAAADPGDLDGLPSDCVDDNSEVHPGAPEVPDGLDQDCDGLIDEGTTARDDDEDGFCELGCTDGSTPGDCDDTDATTYPGAPELLDGEDNDCDGEIDEDSAVSDDDGDGFSEADGDCDDSNALIFPDAPEDGGAGDDIGDAIDNDCDGYVDEETDSYDDDGDGFCERLCTDGSSAGDCDDSDYLISPTALELCDDGLDNDCEGTVDVPDNDGDGAVDDQCGGDDCDDLDPAVYPGAPEVFDTADNDCNGAYDEGFIDPGMLVITEVMRNPAAVPDAQGEYFEVYNPGVDPLNLHGWDARDDDGNTFTILSDLIVEPGERAVLGTLADPANNGGYSPDYVYPYSAVGGMQLANTSDELVLLHEGTEIDRIAYGETWPGGPGSAMELDPSWLDAGSNDDPASWCAADLSYGDGDRGSPGDPGGC